MMQWMTWLSLVEWATRLVMVVLILRRQITPSARLAWLAVVFFVPEVGLLLYLLLGQKRLGRRRVKRYRRMATRMRPQLHRRAQADRDRLRPLMAPSQIPIMSQAEQVGGMDMCGFNHVDLIGDSQQLLAQLRTAIQEAAQHVHLLYYIFEPDQAGQQIAHALMAASRRGVICRVLADAAGSRRLFTSGGLADQMRQAGVEVHPALPAKVIRRRLSRLDLRNHRKLAIIDGKIAFAGSQNLAASSPAVFQKHPWVDLTGRFAGPIVNQLQVVFLEDWTFETGQMLDQSNILPPQAQAGEMFAQAVPSGPTYDSGSFRRVLLTAINVAQRQIMITTPYLVPDEPTQVAIAMAVDRGVRVHIILPQASDHPLVSLASRAHISHLLDCGVNLHLFQKGMLHAKTMTVDDAFALLGSANLDIRSFDLNFEINVLMYGEQITRQLRFVQQGYLAQSLAIDPPQWAKRHRVHQYLENTAALFSPLL